MMVTTDPKIHSHHGNNVTGNLIVCHQIRLQTHREEEEKKKSKQQQQQQQRREKISKSVIYTANLIFYVYHFETF